MCRYFIHIFRTVCWDGNVWGQSNFPLLNAYYSTKLYLIYKFSNLIKTPPGSGQFSRLYYTNLSHWLQLKSLDRETKAGYFWNVNNGRQNRDRRKKNCKISGMRPSLLFAISRPLTFSFDMRASWIENCNQVQTRGEKKIENLYFSGITGKGASGSYRVCRNPFSSFLP